MSAKIEPKYNSLKSIVLTKVIQKLAVELDLTQQELSLIIGHNKSIIDRILNTDASIKEDKSNYLNPLTKEGQLAILLLRLYRNLNVFFCGDAKLCQRWLRNNNEHFGMLPIELIKSAEGLVKVTQYLDAMHGRS